MLIRKSFKQNNSMLNKLIENLNTVTNVFDV